ncbi:MAG: hypothetical protein EOR30_29550 [Mesorhizobium sp.]|uniref:hypothetical protein n=1 Tax=unclassified Mesorhizobium TaxID=325217 RepID=UPI000FCCC334|nr:MULTISPECIES: hypothetical protein [unclassified Mesorhizobium]RUV74806.1 hypothetical protein EOA78_07735 [Mesorhizobium sp. M5C.F.Cr.IN.023.01.1.1]RWF88686.1 MAG: hypothetical protein EOQ36_07630 [Mesorhizobium sp.]RWF92922.1 MAG: hypothetical protein EOQ45_19100 [Mesorhizobium sp.]RWI41245.1 MAG: hypothetical protein EOR14_09230 [Mesorhizobium sp.]RWI49763.1 MAG: hypothetical protein EOR15_12150 [Mesorhizobium sp.]
MMHLSELGGSWWLAISLAMLMAASAIVYGGHSNAVAGQGAHYATEHIHGSSVAPEHGRHKTCDIGHAHDQGTSCASASGCSICVPVDIQVVEIASKAQPTATAPLVISSPGDVTTKPRPPKLLIIA